MEDIFWLRGLSNYRWYRNAIWAAYSGMKTIVGLALLLVPLSASAQSPQWTTFGPVGGAVSVTVDPVDTRTLYAANRGGVFKSTDGGANWLPTAGVAPGQAESVVVDPQNPRNVYAAGRREVFKSTDGGISWLEMKIDPGSINWGDWRLALNPQNPNIIFALAGGDDDVGVGGVWKSVDGGATWRQTPLRAFPSSLIVDRRDPEVIYVGGWQAVHQSIDGGETWAQLAAGIGLLNLAIDREDSNVLYLGAGNGVFKSPDRGRTWSEVPILLANDVKVSVDPHQPATVYASTRRGSFKSMDGGANWRAMSGSLPDVIPAAWDPKDPRTIYYTSNDGLSKSMDGGFTWRRLYTGLATAHVGRIVTDPHRSGTVYAFASNGVFKSTDGARRWNVVAPNANEFALKLVFDPLDSRIVYATRPTGVFKSTDEGVTWRRTAFAGSPGGAFGIDPKNPNTLYASAEGKLFKSTDAAETWHSTGTFPEGYTRALKLEVNPGDPNVLYIMLARGPIFAGTLFRSADGGITWSSPTVIYRGKVYDTASVFSYFTRPAVDPQDPQTMYAAMGLDVFKSTDGGASWLYLGQVVDE